MCAQLFDYCYPIQILIDDFPILSNNYDKFSICDSRIRSGKNAIPCCFQQTEQPFVNFDYPKSFE